MFFAFDFKETKMVIERLRGDRGRSLNLKTAVELLANRIDI